MDNLLIIIHYKLSAIHYKKMQSSAKTVEEYLNELPADRKGLPKQIACSHQ